MSLILKGVTPLGASIDNLAYEIQIQADELFPGRTDDSMFLKLWEELGEFAKDRTEDELADVLIMVLDYASRKMMNIEGAIRKKMAINQQRRWEAKNGVYQHHNRA